MKKIILLLAVAGVGVFFGSAPAQDFDGDGFPDMAVYYPQGAMWYVLNSGGGATAENWGFAGAAPVTGDFDGDGKFDIAVYHPTSGNWYILRSSDHQMAAFNFGWSSAVPVPNDYDRDGKTDLAVYCAALGNWYVLLSSLGNSAFATVNWGFPETVPVSCTLKPVAANPLSAAGVVLADAGGTYALASVTAGENDVADAFVFFNGTRLVYGLPLTNGVAQTYTQTLPLYYGKLEDVGVGDTVLMTVFNAQGELIYQSQNVVVPARPTIISPSEGQKIPAGADAPIAWHPASGAECYLAGYSSEDGTAGADELVSDAAVGVLIAASELAPGAAVMYAASMVADNYEGLGADGANFLAAVGPNSVECEIEAPVGAPRSGVKAPLNIVKEYEKKVEGLDFKVRECDPQQITAPGNVSITIQFRRFKISVAFVQIYDMQGNKYVDWNYKRIFKTHKKTVTVTWGVSPGSTVVFGTHDAHFESSDYTQ